MRANKSYFLMTLLYTLLCIPMTVLADIEDILMDDMGPKNALMEQGACARHSDFVSLIAQKFGATLVWRGTERTSIYKTDDSYELYESRKGWAILRKTDNTYFNDTESCLIDYGNYGSQSTKLMSDIACSYDLSYERILRDNSNLELYWYAANADESYAYTLYITNKHMPQTGKWAIRGRITHFPNMPNLPDCQTILGDRGESFK